VTEADVARRAAPWRVVLADDEPLVRERLRTLLAPHPEFALAAECGDGAAAVEAIGALRPDLVFLDVQMPELDGFEVVEALPEARLPAIVFVTAFDEYAVRAFEVNAVDYLLKPLREERFETALARVAARLARAPEAEAASAADGELRALVADLRARQGLAERFVVRQGTRLTFVRPEAIDWIDAAGNYVRLHAGGRAHLLRLTLKAVEARLDPDRFVRVHRSAIVNLERIVAVEPWFHGEYVLTLADGARLTASRSHSARLRALLR
jgi:two-component system, LytTR family, response regulator